MTLPNEIIKQINVELNKDSWTEMKVIDMLSYMAFNNTNCALIKNDHDETAMITLHETTLQPVFMESCATVYLLNHLDPEIKTGVCGMIYTKNSKDISYLLTIKKRDKLLRFPKDNWSF
jgi:hypothetical protein